MNDDKKYIDPTEWVTKYAVEINFIDEDNDFLRITETLTRIGIANYKQNDLIQTCHLLHKGGKYYITHFKELLALDGYPVNITNDDILRRNRIAGLLEKWNLIVVENPDRIMHQAKPTSFSIISHRDKHKWNLKTKYRIGHSNPKTGTEEPEIKIDSNGEVNGNVM